MSASIAALKSVFRNPDLRRLQLAAVGSVTGQYAFTVVIAVYAYEHGGAAAVGVMAVVRLIPSAVFGPFVSAAGDRFRPERVMLVADLLRVAIVGAIALAVFVDGPTALVFVLSALGPICATLFHPAQAALLPELARTPEELTAANVSASTIDSVGSFVGPAVGGLVLAGWGVGAALLITLAAYAWSGALIFRVRPGAAPRTPAEPTAGTSVAVEALAGFRAVLSDSRLRLVVGLFGAQAAVAGALGVLAVVSSLQLLDLGNAGVGWLYSATGVGGLIGAAIALASVARGRLAFDFGVGLLLWGIPFVILGIWPNTVVALLVLGILGVGNTLVDVSGFTLLQRNAPAAVRSRVFGVLEAVLALTIGLGAILAPLLVSLFGIRAALVVTGLFLPVLAALFWSRLAALDDASPEHLELLRRVPIFSPLPPRALERLAGSVEPVQLDAGAVLFRAGDEGDRFYVVERGQLVVELPGASRLEGPGRWVGEIALLRDVPRTATVRAATDAALLALDRDEFLAAVTGHAPAHDVANELVRERLALSPV
jgi:predicted MFS family arabinose efflux permease